MGIWDDIRSCLGGWFSNTSSAPMAPQGQDTGAVQVDPPRERRSSVIAMPRRTSSAFALGENKEGDTPVVVVKATRRVAWGNNGSAPSQQPVGARTSVDPVARRGRSSKPEAKGVSATVKRILDGDQRTIREVQAAASRTPPATPTSL